MRTPYRDCISRETLRRRLSTSSASSARVRHGSASTQPHINAEVHAPEAPALPDPRLPLIRVLGTVRIEGVDERHRRREQLTALATYLVFFPGARRRDIAERLLDQVTPKSTLAPRMSELRHWLGLHPVSGELLLPRGTDGYRLHPDVTSDLHLLRRYITSGHEDDLRLALNLATGTPFTGVRPRWFQWSSALHAEAHLALTSTALQLTRMMLRQGKYTEAAQTAARGLLLEPSHEGLRRAQWRALHRLGDHQALLRSLQELQATNDALGVSVEPQTRRLYGALRQHGSRSA
jgi:DNA-binding SARP family transcriptional activator